MTQCFLETQGKLSSSFVLLHVRTCKNPANKQVVTSLFTSCCVHTTYSKLLEQVWNKPLATCHKLVGSVRFVTRFFQQD